MAFRFSLLIFLFCYNKVVHCQTPDTTINKIKYYPKNFEAVKKILEADLHAVKLWTHWPSFVTKQVVLEMDNMLYASIFIKKNKIVYMSIYRSPSEDSLIYKYIDSAFSNAILLKRKEKINTNFTFTDLYENYPDFYTPCYSGMLLPEQPSQTMKEIFNLIIKKDLAEILKYQMSFSSENVALGATGLYIWNRHFGNLSEELQTLLKKYQESKDEILYNDGGCIIENRKLSFVLSEYNLENVYRLFVTYLRKSVL